MTLSKRFHIIPPDEDRCVWMTAGIIQYQLCDREFKCEECPLDSAIRRQVRPPAPEFEASPPRLPAAKESALKQDRRYSRNHCWVLNAAVHLLRVGIESGFASVIGRPKAIVLPSLGQAVQAGQTCAWIVTTGGTLPLETPVGGTIRTANALLTDSPHLPHQHPWDQGWLYEVAVEGNGLEESGLISPDRVLDKYAADESRFLAALNNMLRGPKPDAGILLADVQQHLESILEFVGPTRYFNAVRQIYA